jgi:hypothetical protein
MSEQLAMAFAPVADEVGFLTDEDRRTLETIDRICLQHAGAGASEFDIRMRIAEHVPGGCTEIRKRITRDQFGMVCRHYPGVALFDEAIRRFIRAAGLI